ncbi:MAG TPA: PEGA domain-containing protein, partial [Anaeromyxobacter sp.]|nr:PEGA domain-containing protein [Anaeromyxobacter sp.]
RDRIGGVEDVPAMRARLLGQTSGATLSELDRAYGGALAVYQNGEFESSLRTLHAVVEDLESLPESADAYLQWVRAQLRLAHAALSVQREGEAEAALFTLARTDLAITAEPDQYSPAYRRRFEAVKAKVRALPMRRLVVTSEGRPGTVFVNGRARGTTPLTLSLPSGTYRIGGASEDLRVPSFRIDLRSEDRSAVLDFALAEALRVNAGPGLALLAARRGDGIVRAGAWLGVDRIVTVSRQFEGKAAFLLGSMYDVRRGALLREGSVRMVAGTVPAANLGALAAFLLTGQSSRDVVDRTEVARAPPPPPPAAAVVAAPAAPPPARPPDAPPASATPAAASVPPQEPAREPAAASAAAPSKVEPAAATPATKPPAEAAKASLSAAPPAETPDALRIAEASPAGARRGWMRPAAYVGGAVAGGFLILAIQQGLTASSAYSDADAMVAPDGTLLPGSDPARYRALMDDGDVAKRNAYVSAGAAVVFAAAAGYLGWKSMDRPGPALALRF